MLATLTLGFSILPIPILTLTVEESIISDSLVASTHQRVHELSRGKIGNKKDDESTTKTNSGLKHVIS